MRPFPSTSSTTTGNLLAVSPDGQLQWSVPGNGGVPCVDPDSGALYTAGDASLLALHGTTGARLWTYNASDYVTAGAALSPQAPGTLYLGVGESLVAVDASHGAEVWSLGLGAMLLSEVSVDGQGVVYVVTNAGLACVEGANGTLRWLFHAPNPNDPT